MNIAERLIKKTDIEKISRKGAKIYEREISKYEPKQNGKFLAIDIESGETFLARTSSEAVEKAREKHPNRIFYVVRIGYSVVETLANLITKK